MFQIYGDPDHPDMETRDQVRGAHCANRGVLGTQFRKNELSPMAGEGSAYLDRKQGLIERGRCARMCDRFFTPTHLPVYSLCTPNALIAMLLLLAQCADGGFSHIPSTLAAVRSTAYSVIRSTSPIRPRRSPITKSGFMQFGRTRRSEKPSLALIRTRGPLHVS